MTPLRPKFKKKISENPPISQFGTTKKLTPKSEAKIKPSFSQHPFLTIF